MNLIPTSSTIANMIQPIQQQITTQSNLQSQSIQQTTTNTSAPPKKKKKKKTPKEKKPKLKAGEIRLKFALDGSMLFVCPECQVAYPEK